MIMRSHYAAWRRSAFRLAFTTFMAFALAVLLLLGGARAQGQEALRVVVSINPYADLVERVAGERAEVSTLLPPGASPHAFDPSPSQAARLANADLVVMNGGLDDWLTRLVAATSPGASVLVIMESIDFDPQEGHDHDQEEAAEGEAGRSVPLELANPHIWLDPRLAAAAVSAIAGALAELDPGGADAYLANAERTRAELAALDAAVAELLAPVVGAPFVPFHDAWPYFAERYGLDLVVTLEPFPGREPSPRYIAEAVATVKRSGAKAVFAERQLGTRSAEVVADSAGVAVATLDPLGGAPGPTTYEALLLDNAQAIVEALGR